MRVILLASVAALAACATTPAPGRGPAGATAAAEVVGAAGARIGTARFAEGPAGVVIRLELDAGALPAGWHGAHLHQNGDCSDPAAGFKNAGAHAGHAASAAPAHGLLNAAGPEAGDLANFHAPASGPIAAEFYAPSVTLGAVAVGSRLPLRGPGGAALVVHADADDHTSQPIGGAGARIACAALRP
jgi:Cu-Zn family superoxide dismutase